jgi:hypothetical protein
VSTDDPGLRTDDLTESELALEDRRRSGITVVELAAYALAEHQRLRSTPPRPELRPMFPEREEDDGRKRE